MKFTDTQWLSMFVIVVLSITVGAVIQGGHEYEDAMKKRQIIMDQFAAKYHCKPIGYIPTRGRPVREYQCDHGVFIAEDMR